MKFLAASTLLSTLLVAKVNSFAPAHQTTSLSSSLNMAGMGMGGGAGTKSKSKNGKKTSGKASAGSPFDIPASMLKSEKLYDVLTGEKGNDNDDLITSEYMVTARITPSAMADMTIPGAASVSDWVPVAQLCLRRHVNELDGKTHIRDCPRVQTAVSFYCREINYIATKSASIFKSIPRSQIEYAAEPIDSFNKFIYDDVIKGKNQDEKNENTMSKVEARSVLELEDTCNDAGEFKRAYRKLTFKLHPDRFVGMTRTDEEAKQSAIDFGKVKLAYESLSSGVRSGGSRSWYESLGGKSRTEFSGGLKLLPLGEAKEVFEAKKYESAVTGLNTQIVMSFVTRHQAAAM